MDSKISNLNIQELLIHFIIVLALLFNCSIKPNMRFLTKTSKLSILLLQHTLYLHCSVMVISVSDDKHC